MSRDCRLIDVALENKNDKDVSVIDVDADKNLDLLEGDELEEYTGEDKDIIFEEEGDPSAMISGLIKLLSPQWMRWLLLQEMALD